MSKTEDIWIIIHLFSLAGKKGLFLNILLKSLPIICKASNLQSLNCGKLTGIKIEPMMRSRYFILLLSFLCCSYPSLLGQSSWLFKQLEVRNGLSHNRVNHIFKDSNGFMWFSTASGLNRYDGYKFKVFFHNPNYEYSLPDNLVNSVQEDITRLWIHTANDNRFQSRKRKI